MSQRNLKQDSDGGQVEGSPADGADNSMPRAATASSRRSFVLTSAARLAALCGGIHLASQPRRAYASTVDDIRIGLVGCGGRGTNLARIAMRNESACRLVAMGDLFKQQIDQSLNTLRRDRGNRDQVVASSGDTFIGFDAYRHVIASDVDFVILATPPAFRPAHFTAAMEAGKHAYVEKPVAVDPPGVRRVMQANEIAIRKRLHVSSGLTHRHSQRYKQLLAQIGQREIREMEISISGTVWGMVPRQPTMSEIEYQIRNFRRFAWLGGGHMLEKLVHNLDNCNWFLGSHPLSASGTGGFDERLGPHRGDIFDRLSTRFNYADGVILDATTDFTGTSRRTQETVQGDGWRASLNEGALYQGGSRASWSFGTRADPFNDNQLKSIFSGIMKGEVVNEIAYSCDATFAAIMGRMAAVRGRTVTWDEVTHSNEALAAEEITSMDAPPPVRPDKFGDYQIPAVG